MSNLDRGKDSVDQPEPSRRQFLAGLLATSAAGLVAGEAEAQTIQGARKDGERIAAGMRDVAANMEREGMAQLLAGMKEAVDNAQSKNPNIPRAQIIASFKRQKPEWPWDKIK